MGRIYYIISLQIWSLVNFHTCSSEEVMGRVCIVKTVAGLKKLTRVQLCRKYFQFTESWKKIRNVSFHTCKTTTSLQ